MESAGKRHRHKPKPNGSSVQEPTFGLPIPHFTVNLSLRPEDRYTHIVPHLPDLQTTNFATLFDELVGAILPPSLAKLIRKSASLLLRRLHSDEETAELRGISKATGIEMYLLVAFNLLLDILLGCTSGGVLVEKPEQGGWREGMMHFRTLDWGMDPLRKIVVKLDFVRREGGEVIATTVGYFGYVGVLTGVRQGLSVSLNFRPYHDGSSLRKRLDFRRHQVMVILGMRPSVSSVLRGFLFSGSAGRGTKASSIRRGKGAADKSDRDDEGVGPVSMEEILAELSTSSSTAAYLIFCTPDRVYSIEKDNRAAFVRSSDTFLTTYNHDAIDEGDPEAIANAARQFTHLVGATGMGDVVLYGRERKERMDKMHAKKLRRHRRKFKRKGEAVGLQDVFDFISDRWITNEETHYTVVMDPAKGEVVWCRKLEAVESDSEESDIDESGEPEPGSGVHVTAE